MTCTLPFSPVSFHLTFLDSPSQSLLADDVLLIVVLFYVVVVEEVVVQLALALTYIALIVCEVEMSHVSDITLLHKCCMLMHTHVTVGYDL